MSVVFLDKPPLNGIKCFYRNPNRTLGCTIVNTDCYENAIQWTHEGLIECEIEVEAPILALIEGGKNAN